MAEPSLYVRRDGDDFYAASEASTPRNAASLFAEEEEVDVGHEIDVIRATEATAAPEGYNAEDDGWPLVPVPGERWRFLVTGTAGEVTEVPRG